MMRRRKTNPATQKSSDPDLDDAVQLPDVAYDTMTHLQGLGYDTLEPIIFSSSSSWRKSLPQQLEAGTCFIKTVQTEPLS